jgi:hypothetical protein
MARQHSKDTYTSLGGVNLTAHANDSKLTFTGDDHDLTVYGKGSHVFGGGLKSGTATISGFYDTSLVDGPRAVILPMVMTVVEFIHRPEGTGSGKPQDRGQVLVKSYEQSSPVADYVKWTAELMFSDDTDSSVQA